MNPVGRDLLARVVASDSSRASAEGTKDLDGGGEVGVRRYRAEKRVPRRATEAVRAPAARFERLEKIRAAVFERAAGRCEAWAEVGGLPERCGREAAVLDRWEGPGSGPQQETVEMYWALCVKCSWERIANDPGAAHWQRSFELHRKVSRQRLTSHVARSA